MSEVSASPEIHEPANKLVGGIAKKALPVVAAVSLLPLTGCLDRSEEYCQPQNPDALDDAVKVGMIGDSIFVFADEGKGVPDENANNYFCQSNPDDFVASASVFGQSWEGLMMPGVFLESAGYGGDVGAFNLPGEEFLSEEELAQLGYTPTPEPNDVEPIDPATAPDILVTDIGNNDLHNYNPTPENPKTPEEALQDARDFMDRKYKFVAEGAMCTVAVEVVGSDIWFDPAEVAAYNDGLHDVFDVVVSWENIVHTNPEFLNPKDEVHIVQGALETYHSGISNAVNDCKATLTSQN